jgi:hypothetical protein
MRSSIVRVLGVATVVGALLCAVVLGYGLLKGPPAPIRPVQDGYGDRYGNIYTADEFARFVLWERVLFSAVAVTFVAGFACVAFGPKQRASGDLATGDRETLEAALDRIDQVIPDVAAELRARGPLARRPPHNPDAGGS